jgi:hypothetical protein
MTGLKETPTSPNLREERRKKNFGKDHLSRRQSKGEYMVQPEASLIEMLFQNIPRD